MMGIGVEQQRPEGEIAGDLGRSLERHVEGRRHLRGRARGVDLDPVAAHPDRDLERQGDAAGAAVIVEEAFRHIVAVGILAISRRSIASV